MVPASDASAVGRSKVGGTSLGDGGSPSGEGDPLSVVGGGDETSPATCPAGGIVPQAAMSPPNNTAVPTAGIQRTNLLTSQ